MNASSINSSMLKFTYLSEFFVKCSFYKRVLVLFLFFIMAFNVKSMELSGDCLDENPCDFALTKINCSGDTIEVCFESLINPGNQNWINQGNHEWIIQDLGGNELCSSGLFGTSYFCCKVLGVTTIKVIHNIIYQNSECQALYNYSFDTPACEYDCSTLNFDYSVAQTGTCLTTLTIDGSGLSDFTWSFGDGTRSVRTNDDKISHQYPLTGGTFHVCLVFHNISFEHEYMCCFDVTIPCCVNCSNSSLTWQECDDQFQSRIQSRSNVPYPDCCIKLTFHHPCSEPEYFWDFGDGNTDITNVPFVDHYFTDDIYKNICVKFTANGSLHECCFRDSFPPCKCCNTAEFYVSTYPSPSDEFSCFNSYFHVEPFCNLGGYVTHVWEYSDGFRYEGIYPPDHYFTNFITMDGDVWIRHTVHCGTSTLTSIQHFTIQPGVHVGNPDVGARMTDPVPTKNNMPLDQFIQMYSNDPSVPLVIEGKLIVDKTTSFSGGIWYMAHKSIILVQGHQFNLDHTTIQSARHIGRGSAECCRWIGIQSRYTNTFSWDGAIIKDAKRMLDFLPNQGNGSFVDMKDCMFVENNYGIYDIGQWFLVNRFENNEFSGVAITNPPTHFCYCDFFEAIHLQTIRQQIIFPSSESRNRILFYQIAVHCINASLEIRSFDIYDINFDGIWFENQPAFSNSKTLNLDLISFTRMPIAVLDQYFGGSKHYLTAIASQPYTSILMNSVHRGYDITINASQLKGTISKNTINTSDDVESNFGIQANLIATSNNTLNATYNHLNINGGAGHTSLGINLKSDMDVIQDANILHNIINNGSTNTGPGIRVENCKNSDIEYNQIESYETKNGIEMVNSGASYPGASVIKCNVVNDGNYGINLNLSPANDIRNNRLLGNNKCLVVNGDCNGTGSFIGLNTFYDSDLESVYYGALGETGPQYHSKYNSWLPVNGSEEAINVSNKILKSQIWAPSNAGIPSVHHPRCRPNNLIINSGATTISDYDCIDIFDPDHMSILESGSQYNQFLSDTSWKEGLNEAERITTEQTIYKYILENPIWIDSFANLASFYTDQNADFIGQSIGIENKLKTFDDTIAMQITELQPLENNLDTLLRNLFSADSLLLFTTDTNIIHLLTHRIDSLNALITNISDSISNKQLHFQTENLIRINRIDSLNNLFAEETNYQRDEKFINHLLIKRMIFEGLSATEYDSLRALAQKCFLQEGRTVFQANGLCVVELAEYFSQADCLEQLLNKHPVISAMKIADDAIHINPNPVRNLLHVNISKDWLDESIPEISISDLTGKKLELQVRWLATNKSNCTISTNEIPNGVYIINVYTKNKSKIKKFTVQH